ncbi:MAG: OmpA family protein [Proteobacteria bacterium]|nr:OmpA family protein [Pseudomonadota bacterium]
MDEQAAILKKEPAIKLEIVGHTERSGQEAYHQGLSVRRPKGVKQYSISKGIAPARLTPAGYGESGPIAPNDTTAGQAINRRVELNVLEKELSF